MMICVLASVASADPLELGDADGIDLEDLWLDVPMITVPPGTDTRGIVNGTNAGSNDYPETVAIYSSWYGGQFCSGTLIHPDWVLTAGHCVEDPILTLVNQGRVEVRFGTNANSPAATYDVDAGYIHPNFVNTPSNISNDVALLHLDRSVTGYDPAVLNDEVVSNGWVGDELSFVGFGATSDTGAGTGTKRYADVEVEGYDVQIVYSFDRNDNDGHQNVCYGDSGGSSFENETSGRELAGVNSFVYAERSGDDPCREGGNGIARVDIHLGWIDDYVPDLRLSPDDPPQTGSGTTTEPDPPDIIDTGVNVDPLDLDHDEWTAATRPTKGIYGPCATGATPVGGATLLLLAALVRRRR